MSEEYTKRLWVSNLCGAVQHSIELGSVKKHQEQHSSIARSQAGHFPLSLRQQPLSSDQTHSRASFRWTYTSQDWRDGQ